jgi:hypothetical protein
MTYRTSIFWEYLYGFDRTTAAHLLTHKDYAGHPAVTDVRIKPPPPPERIARANMLLTCAMALGLLEYQGKSRRTHLFRYSRVGQGKVAQTWPFSISDEYTKAVDALALDTEAMDGLRDNVQRAVLADNDAAAKRLLEAKDYINKCRVQSGSNSRLDQGDLPNYNFRNAQYSALFTGIIWGAKVFGLAIGLSDHPWAEFYTRNEIVPGGRAATQDGWYCEACGHNLGANEPDWNDRCPIAECGHPVGPHVNDEPPAGDAVA